MIGAGVREDAELLELFELLVNCVIRNAPNARLVFNATLDDTVDAVRRGLAMA